jgi:hypothetical protein
VDDIPDPIGAGEGDLGDLGDRHTLGAQQDHLGSPQVDHPPTPPAQDTQQAVAFSLVKLAHLHPFGHHASSFAISTNRSLTEQGERCLTRH